MTINLLFIPGVLAIISSIIISLAYILSSQKIMQKYSKYIITISNFLVIILPIYTLVLIWNLTLQDYSINFVVFDYTLQIRNDYLARLFGTIFTLATFLASIFALNNKNYIEKIAALIYASSAICVVFAGDLITLFLFWEVMAITSTIIIFQGNYKNIYYVGSRYISIHILSGMLLMIGIIGHINTTDSVYFGVMTTNNIFDCLIFVSFAINAGAPLLSFWIPDSYSSASFSGSVFLSSFTTKTAIYTLIRGFPGENMLIILGIYMIIYGIIYALLENNIRRILSYAIVNQLGFMMVGIGIGTSMALNGVALHAFSHILYKSLLFMTAGAVIYQTNKQKCTDLGGLFQYMPITTACGIIGALSMSFPLTTSYISKPIIIHSALMQGLTIPWYLLEIASVGVFFSAGLKYIWYVFFQNNKDIITKEPPINMQIAMIVTAIFCVLPGIVPNFFSNIMPFLLKNDLHYYEINSLVNNMQFFILSILAFFLFLPYIKVKNQLLLDFDWFYKKLPIIITNFISINIINNYKISAGKKTIIRLLNNIQNYIKKLVLQEHSQAQCIQFTLVLLMCNLIFYTFFYN